MLLDVDAGARAAAEVDPALVLDGEMPRLIDEWHLVPEVWNHVRRRVDDRVGADLLTGSAVPTDDATRHTGAVRIARVRMRTMTLAEAGPSTGEVSLRAVLDGERHVAADAGMTVPDMAEEISTGGWPGLRDLPPAHARRALRDYLEDICRTDVQRVDGVSRDPDRVRRLLRSVARNLATRAQMLADVNFLGLLFESLVVRDLRVYAQPFEGRVSQYRDNKGLEVDAIVEAGDGRWAAFEVKLSQARIDDAAASLRQFAGKVDTAKAGEPAALAVITATGYAYVRDDGVHVIPLATLGP